MKRQFAFALLFAVGSASTALAQAPAKSPSMKPSPQSDSTMTALIGSWEGSVYSDHAPESTMKMTFTKSPAFGVVVSIVSSGQEFVDGPSTELKVDGTAVMWKQSLMQTQCKAEAVLLDGNLKGGIDCGHGGITFLAKRK